MISVLDLVYVSLYCFISLASSRFQLLLDGHQCVSLKDTALSFGVQSVI